MMDMKRIYNILLIMILSLFLLPLGGCFDSDINRSMYEADGEEMQRENHIVGATLKGMQGLVIPTREHLYQFMDAMAGGAYGGYLEGIVDTWVMKFSTFNPEQGWLKSPFADPIKDMYPQYRDMLNKTDDSVALAFGKILRVCIMHRVTDIYGPIPYSKMMDNDNSGEDLAVPYDSQEQVYTQMLKELEEADKVLEENKDLSSEAFRKLEDLYYGNISKWRKFVQLDLCISDSPYIHRQGKADDGDRSLHSHYCWGLYSPRQATTSGSPYDDVPPMLPVPAGILQSIFE